jgi:hypothetical protein
MPTGRFSRVKPAGIEMAGQATSVMAETMRSQST